MPPAPHLLDQATAALDSAVLEIRRRQLWMWGLPIMAGAAVLMAPSRLLSGLVAMIGVGVLAAIAARPHAAASALVALLPFQIFLFAGLYRIGLPAQLIRWGSYWKEAVVVGLGLVAVRRMRQTARHLDGLDWACLVYVASVSLYLLLPDLMAAAPGPGEPGPPKDLLVRLLAFRVDTFLVLLLLFGRHAGFDRGTVTRLASVLLAVGGVVAALGIFEFVLGDLWYSVVVDWLQIPAYQAELFGDLNARLRDVLATGQVGSSGDAYRTGSVFLSPLSLGFFLVAPLAVGAERIVRSTHRGWEWVATGAVCLCLLLTQTRSAILGGLIVGGLTLGRLPGRSSQARTRVALAGMAALLLLSPLAATAGLTDRVGSTGSAGDESSADHLTGLSTGLRVLGHRPLGGGLGTAAGIGQRFEVEGTVVPENYYLQVGNEVGLQTMVAFLVVGGLAIAGLGRSAARTLSPTAGALRSAAIALAVGGIFLHVFSDLQVAWPIWLLAGAAIGLPASAGTGPAPVVSSIVRPSQTG